MPGRKLINITKAQVKAIKAELDAASRGQAEEILTRWQRVIEQQNGGRRCSFDTIHRRIRNQFGNRKQVKRKSSYDPQVARDAIRIYETAWAIVEAPLPVHIIRRHLAAEGWPESDIPSKSHLTTMMKALGWRREKRYRRIETEHALQRVQCDLSRSEALQLEGTYDAETDDYLLKVTNRALAYKGEDQVLRSWMIALKDDYSRLRFVQMVAAPGESHPYVIEFLRACWDETDTERAFRHVPPEGGIFQMDRGATMRAGPFKAFLHNLGLVHNMTQSKEAGGKIENQFRWLWCQFEASLAYELGKGGTIWMSEYNARLRQYCIDEGKTAHPTRPERTRETEYLSSLRTVEPRYLTGDLLQYLPYSFVRQVDAYGCVKFKHKGAQYYYQCPDYCTLASGKPHPLTKGTRVKVTMNPKGVVVAELADVYSKPFRIKDHAPTMLGSYNSPPQTEAERIKGTITPRKPGSAPASMAPAGEAARPISIRTLPPEPAPVEGKGILAGRQLPNPKPNSARAFIARRLSAAGLRYADHSQFFEPFLGKLSQEQLALLSDTLVTRQSQKKRADQAAT